MGYTIWSTTPVLYRQGTVVKIESLDISCHCKHEMLVLNSTLQLVPASVSCNGRCSWNAKGVRFWRVPSLNKNKQMSNKTSIRTRLEMLLKVGCRAGNRQFAIKQVAGPHIALAFHQLKKNFTRPLHVVKDHCGFDHNLCS